jgi:hypothetical protein
LFWVKILTVKFLKFTKFNIILIKANLASKASAIHGDKKRKRKALQAMEEGKAQADIQLKDLNANVIEKSIKEKTAESMAEAIVKDIEHEISEKFNNS